VFYEDRSSIRIMIILSYLVRYGYEILVMSDVHGNLEALRAVLDKESDADEVIFLGISWTMGRLRTR